MKKKIPTEEELAKLGVKSWGIWEKEKSIFDWSYSDTETCYILEGEIELLYGTEIYLLRKGDYAYFDSHTPHNARSIGEKKAKTLVIIFLHKRL